MYFLIGGVQPRTVRLEKQSWHCSSCSSSEVYMTRVDHYLSLFFIPLFPVKKGTPFLMCHRCKTVYDEQGGAYHFDARSGTTCPGCGAALDPAFSFCPYCGKRI